MLPLGLPVSNALRQYQGMKDSRIEAENHVASSEIIAFFGNALLVRWADGPYQIQGGSGEDRKQAAEWAARFMDVRFGRTEVLLNTR